MAIWWGRVQQDHVWMPLLAGAVLFAATCIAVAAGEPQWRQDHLVHADIPQQRIVVLPAAPDHWRLCDGLDGACFEIRHLRVATASITGRVEN